MRYELFISLRYLRAKRREAFISLITLISILGVTISVTTLDIALSVTTGFENDLRTRILGFTLLPLVLFSISEAKVSRAVSVICPWLALGVGVVVAGGSDPSAVTPAG